MIHIQDEGKLTSPATCISPASTTASSRPGASRVNEHIAAPEVCIIHGNGLGGRLKSVKFHVGKATSPAGVCVCGCTAHDQLSDWPAA